MQTASIGMSLQSVHLSIPVPRKTNRVWYTSTLYTGKFPCYMDGDFLINCQSLQNAITASKIMCGFKPGIWACLPEEMVSFLSLRSFSP